MHSFCGSAAAGGLEIKRLGLALLLAACLTFSAAPVFADASLPFDQKAAQTPSTASQEMGRLALSAIGNFREEDREQYLDTLFRLQLVAGRYEDAGHTVGSLVAMHANDPSPQAAARVLQYQALAEASAQAARTKKPLRPLLAEILAKTLAGLDDKASALLVRSLSVETAPLQKQLQEIIDRHKGQASLPLADAVELLVAYQVQQAYSELAPIAPAVIAADDSRRYLIERDARVPTVGDGVVCALIVRPRAVVEPAPALLTFTIYADAGPLMGEARRSASNGYGSIVGLTRGKGCSPGAAVPYEHDGEDAAALIEWISRQPWSDGRVGMYGGSYSGFTQWSALKRMPKALKAIMASAPAAPGIDAPMEGGVVWNFMYPWPFYTTNLKGLDDPTYNDAERWRRLDRAWYTNGKAYRDLEKIDGTPNPIFASWLNHPSYDAFWKQLIPYGDEFGRIDIPVLATAGYYYGGPGAAVYYLSQHQKHRTDPNHYLVIGPYDHIRGQRGTVSALGDRMRSLQGYELDPVAQMDFIDLRYQWFDYIFKGKRKPAILADKINYQVTGANIWKHAPSIAEMSKDWLRLHLSSSSTNGVYHLTSAPVAKRSIRLTVDLADRSDVDRVVPGGGVQDTAIDTWAGIELVSDPLPAMELSGLFRGRFDFITNKRDFDFEIDLYELTPAGAYIQLPPYWSRASYVEDLERRRLLTPGRRESLTFVGTRLMSRRVQAGSRIVAVLRVIKEPGRQINYGSGKPVSDETIADAGAPLTIDWLTSSYLELPIGR